jgi:hypothetical protein
MLAETISRLQSFLSGWQRIGVAATIVRGAVDSASLARADVPECFRDGVICEPGLVDLAGTIQGQ